MILYPKAHEKVNENLTTTKTYKDMNEQPGL